MEKVFPMNALNCPRCHGALQPGTYEADVQVDGCPSCGGLWLDQRELERIEESLVNNYADPLSRPDNSIDRAYEVARQNSRTEVTCPKCGREMSKKECHPASLVLVDVCPDCAGLWLDRGEIQSLEVFFERMRLEEKEAAKRGFLSGLRRLFGG
jgi:Zn-finger nucleic acid-binding protein